MAAQAEIETLVSKMSNSIWLNESICKEDKYLKKKWFVRNCQETDRASKWEKPCMAIVVQNVRKKNVCFGPVIQVSEVPFFSGKGKERVEKEALSFLCLSKEHGFHSLIVNPDEYDMEFMKKFTDDIVVKEVLAIAEGRTFSQDNWFKSFAVTCEEMLLP